MICFCFNKKKFVPNFFFLLRKVILAQKYFFAKQMCIQQIIWPKKHVGHQISYKKGTPKNDKGPQKHWEKNLQKKVMHKKRYCKKKFDINFYLGRLFWQSKKSVAKKNWSKKNGDQNINMAKKLVRRIWDPQKCWSKRKLTNYIFSLVLLSVHI